MVIPLPIAKLQCIVPIDKILPHTLVNTGVRTRVIGGECNYARSFVQWALLALRAPVHDYAACADLSRTCTRLIFGQSLVPRAWACHKHCGLGTWGESLGNYPVINVAASPPVANQANLDTLCQYG